MRRFGLRVLGVIVALGGFPAVSLASEHLPLTIKMISFYDDATNPEYEGPMTSQYLALNRRIMESAGISFNLQTATIYEARAIFSRGSVDLHYPGICAADRQRQVIYSDPLFNFDRYLIAMGDQPPVESLDMLRGKTLGLVHRFIYQLPSARELNAMEIRLFHAKSIAANVRMLLNGRVDAILAPVEALGNVQQRLQLNRTFSIPPKPFSSNPICYVAHNSERGNEIMTRINRAVAKLRVDGELRLLAPEGARIINP